MYFQTKEGTKQHTYDAIVVGTGISGGWAAKELCEKGLKTLVLERGRMVKHVEDYPTMMTPPWELARSGRVPTREIDEHYPKQMRTGYTIREATKHWWVKDSEHPYQEVERFDWIRGYHVGGRSIMWGRQSYRLSDLDFEANAKEGIAVDWPIRYRDLAPWYDYVEGFAGVNGSKENLPQLPDGNFLPAMPMNCLEEHMAKRIRANFDDRVMIMGRSANLTKAIHGRGACQYRNLCMRGCPYGGYFSSNASTLPAAAATGNMTLRPHSIVTEVIYDADKQQARGVRILDAETNETSEYYAKIVFLNASALNSTWILMNSKSDRFPTGMGNDSGELGHNVMDHHFRVGASGRFDGFEDRYYSGRRPNGPYIPRFQNLPWNKATKKDNYLRGFGYQGRGSRDNWTRGVRELAFGESLKLDLMQPGPWRYGMTAFGECLPYHENKIELDESVRDVHGLPTLKMDAKWRENEWKMREDMAVQGAEILEAAGLKDVYTYDAGSYPGLGIHEMGTARMGRDPKTSVLNKYNQIHAVPNVFMTDGAAMTSAGCQNPSLTYMALTARAADHAVKELNRRNLG